MTQSIQSKAQSKVLYTSSDYVKALKDAGKIEKAVSIIESGDSLDNFSRYVQAYGALVQRVVDSNDMPDTNNPNLMNAHSKLSEKLQKLEKRITAASKKMEITPPSKELVEMLKVDEVPPEKKKKEEWSWSDIAKYSAAGGAAVLNTAILLDIAKTIKERYFTMPDTIKDALKNAGKEAGTLFNAATKGTELYGELINSVRIAAKNIGIDAKEPGNAFDVGASTLGTQTLVHWTLSLVALKSLLPEPVANLVIKGVTLSMGCEAVYENCGQKAVDAMMKIVHSLAAFKDNNPQGFELFLSATSFLVAYNSEALTAFFTAVASGSYLKTGAYALSFYGLLEFLKAHNKPTYDAMVSEINKLPSASEVLTSAGTELVTTAKDCVNAHPIWTAVPVTAVILALYSLKSSIAEQLWNGGAAITPSMPTIITLGGLVTAGALNTDVSHVVPPLFEGMRHTADWINGTGWPALKSSTSATVNFCNQPVEDVVEAYPLLSKVAPFISAGISALTVPDLSFFTEKAARLGELAARNIPDALPDYTFTYRTWVQAHAGAAPTALDTPIPIMNQKVLAAVTASKKAASEVASSDYRSFIRSAAAIAGLTYPYFIGAATKPLRMTYDYVNDAYPRLTNVAVKPSILAALLMTLGTVSYAKLTGEPLEMGTLVKQDVVAMTTVALLGALGLGFYDASQVVIQSCSSEEGYCGQALSYTMQQWNGFTSYANRKWEEHPIIAYTAAGVGGATTLTVAGFLSALGVPFPLALGTGLGFGAAGTLSTVVGGAGINAGVNFVSNSYYSEDGNLNLAASYTEQRWNDFNSKVVKEVKSGVKGNWDRTQSTIEKVWTQAKNTEIADEIQPAALKTLENLVEKVQKHPATTTVATGAGLVITGGLVASGIGAIPAMVLGGVGAGLATVAGNSEKGRELDAAISKALYDTSQDMIQSCRSEEGYCAQTISDIQRNVGTFVEKVPERPYTTTVAAVAGFVVTGGLVASGFGTIPAMVLGGVTGVGLAASTGNSEKGRELDAKAPKVWADLTSAAKLTWTSMKVNAGRMAKESILSVWDQYVGPSSVPVDKTYIPDPDTKLESLNIPNTQVTFKTLNTKLEEPVHLSPVLEDPVLEDHDLLKDPDLWIHHLGELEQPSTNKNRNNIVM